MGKVNNFDSYVVFDLETTGLSPKRNEIIEIGAIKYLNNKQVTRFRKYVKPSAPIPPFIQSLTHITNEMVADAQPIQAVLPQFLEFIGDLPLIAHNASFDIGFLNEQSLKILNKPVANAVVDTLILARLVLPELPNFKLISIKEYYNVPVENMHNAISDCVVTSYFYTRCKNDHADKLCSSYPMALVDTSMYNLPDFKCSVDIIKKNICLTGDFKIGNRTALENCLNLTGATCTTNVTQKTNYLVIGALGSPSWKYGTFGTKYQKAVEYQNKGLPIQILKENNFIKVACVSV